MQIGMLGPFEVRVDDGVRADVPGARLRGLLAALALEPGRVVAKATLVDWIWGEHPPADATNALQRLVSRLRKALPEGTVEGQPDGYRLKVDPDAVDAVRFERLLARARDAEGPGRVGPLRDALGLWRGAAMQDVGLTDSTAFDAAVTRLEGLRLTAAEDRFDAEVDLGHAAGLVTELTDAVTAHPLRERLVAALMRAHVAAGRDTEALLVYQRAREALAETLGVDPSPELSALHVALLRGELGRREEHRKTNLRAELTSYIGKDADVAAVRGLVVEHRLTTLIGPGGSGKTRLAAETARTLLGDLPDGAWLVELAPLGADGDQAGGNGRHDRAQGGNGRQDVTRADGNGRQGGSGREDIAQAGGSGRHDVAQGGGNGEREVMQGGTGRHDVTQGGTGRHDVTQGGTGRHDVTQGGSARHDVTQGGSGRHDVAQAALAALGLRDALLGGTPNAEPTDRLIAAIRDREALLVLDNCEHVIESAAAFAHRVLGECRRLRVLATSREPLGITGEALWPVVPLALPSPDADVEEVRSSPAVRLLRDRAGAVRRDLVPDARTWSTMAHVCRALDGMPLAIELAAARLRTLSLDQLAHQLDDRFRLLTSGSRTALPRHKTLRAVVDWSWELLTDAERAVLRRLSVFAGGAGLEAAERVCAGEDVEPWQVPELLTALTEKSLLVADGDGAPRYRMLGTIKEYAAHRLAEAGEADRARRAHLAHFTELAETAEPHLRRAGQLAWLADLAAEHDNLGAAMRGALAAGDAHAAMRLAAAAGWYWWLAGHKSEGMELITAANATPGEVPDEIRGIVYGLISMFVTTGPAGEQQVAEWVHRAYEIGLRVRSRHPALRLVVPVEHMVRAPDAVLPAWESLLADEDPWVRALSRLHLGKMRVVLGQGGSEADEHLETALAEFRALGERFGISFALTELADRIATRGRFAEACELYGQAVVVVTEVGAVEDIIRLRSRQAQLYWLLGDEDAASTATAEAERCAARVTWPGALAHLALSKAELARWRGDAAEARRQLGVVADLLGDDAEQAYVRAGTHDLLGYLADDLEEARRHRAAACEAAAEGGHAPTIAHVLVGVADLALRRDRHDEAARLLAASAAVRGLPDRSHPDVARIERAARERLGEARFTEAAGEGAVTGWGELVAVTLAP